MSMSVSLQKSTKKTNIRHNNRTEKNLPNNIDRSRSDLNNYLVQKNIRELYENEFGKALEKYNAKQKRSDRKIKNYYNHILASKRTATQQEMIVQVGDINDFAIVENWGVANDVLEEWFEGFQERNPNLKVYNAVIHNDEASPHLHLNFVPVASGYKRSLEKQVAFDRAIIQQDSSLNKERPFFDWREKEVQVLTELLQERGIERKLVGTNNFKDVNEFKQKKDELRELEIKVENELEKLAIIEEVPENKSNVPEPIIVPPDYRPMPEVELKKTLTGRYIVEPSEIEDLKEYANYQKQKNDELQKEVKDRDESLNKWRRVHLKEQGAIDRLVDHQIRLERQNWSSERFKHDKEVYELSSTLKSLENENKALRSENRVLQQWKERAIKFMQNTKVFERFETWLKNLSKNRNNDFER